MGKKQRKSGAKKKKRAGKKYRPLAEKQSAASGESGGGAMQSMVGGFRRAVGVEKSKKGRSDYIWTILLVLAVAAVLFWRFAPE